MNEGIGARIKQGALPLDPAGGGFRESPSGLPQSFWGKDLVSRKGNAFPTTETNPFPLPLVRYTSGTARQSTGLPSPAASPPLVYDVEMIWLMVVIHFPVLGHRRPRRLGRAREGKETSMSLRAKGAFERVSSSLGNGQFMIASLTCIICEKFLKNHCNFPQNPL